MIITTTTRFITTGNNNKQIALYINIKSIKLIFGNTEKWYPIPSTSQGISVMFNRFIMYVYIYSLYPLSSESVGTDYTVLL